MDFQFAKDRYDYELQRKEQLTAALTLPVGVLSILAGGIGGRMAGSFSYRDPLLSKVFAPVMATDVIAIALCLVYLARAYHRQRYVYLPLLKDLLDWEQEYEEYARCFQADGAQRDDALLERIIEAADRNTVNNDRRSELLYRARSALFAVLCLTAVAGIPYVADQVRYQMPRQETPAATRPVPQDPRPTPPPAPPNREIREGDVPPRR